MGLILGHHLPIGPGPQGLVRAGAPVIAPQSTTLLPGADEAPGDRLFAFGGGTAGGIIVDGTWTQLNTLPFLNFVLFTKIAAGAASDEARLSGFIGQQVAVGVKFTFKDIPGPGSWDFNAQGSQVASDQTSFINGQLNAFLAPAPSISIYVGVRRADGINAASGPGGFSDPLWTTAPDGGVVLQAKTTDTIVPTSTYWHAINWNFQAIKTTYPAGKFWSGADPGSLHATTTRGWRYDHD
ncbi:MAG: hypothetical protein KAS38_07395 [Anaerolineales bacterium]|nr:hypothetical protein [Anaerolineales bacterium]